MIGVLQSARSEASLTLTLCMRLSGRALLVQSGLEEQSRRAAGAVVAELVSQLDHGIHRFASLVALRTRPREKNAGQGSRLGCT